MGRESAFFSRRAPNEGYGFGDSRLNCIIIVDFSYKV